MNSTEWYFCLDSEPEFKSILYSLDDDFFYRHWYELHKNTTFALFQLWKRKGYSDEKIICKIKKLNFRTLTN